MYGGLSLVTPPSVEPVTLADAKAHSRISNQLDDSLLLGYIAAARATCEMITRRAFLPQTWKLALSHWPGRDPESRRSETNPDWNEIRLPMPPLRSITSFTYKDTAGNSYSMTQGYGTSDNYLLDLASEPGRLVLPFAGIWPVTILLPANPIQIVYQCGYDAFSGTMNVDVNGVGTRVSGDYFDSIPPNTWITIGGQSFAISTINSSTSMQLATAPSAPLSAAAFQANAVPMPIRNAILLLAGHLYENRESVVVGRTTTIATEIPFTIDALLSSYRIWGSI